MIIDCHCHAGTGDGLYGPWDTRASLTQYLRWARDAEIDRTIVFPPFHSDYAQANAEVAQIVARHPERLTGFAMVHPTSDRGRVRAMVQTAVSRYGFRGIKVHRHDGRITREICQTARELGLCVLYDVMGETAPIELFAREYADVNFIIPHLGSFADDWRAQLAFIDHLVRHPNVYTDTSGVRRFGLLEAAVQRAGPGKVLFGSDGPWLHPGVELEKVRLLKLDPRAEAMVLAGNVVQLLRPRAPRRASVAPVRRLAAVASADPWTPADDDVG